MTTPPAETAALIAELARRFPDSLFAGESQRAQHGRDESRHPAAPPDAVFLPGSTEEAAEAMRLCARFGVPVIPFGTGSGQEGGVLAVRGGISFGTQRLDRILELNAADMDAHVEAGVTRLQLDRALRDTGLFLPVDPGADASIGGMAATGAAGTTTPRYGTMHQAVIGLEAVMADGSVIRTGGRARKSSSGYDLTRLLVGSEGTLGLITRVRLRLHPRPEAVLVLRACFATPAAAVEAVALLTAAGLPLARAELLDAVILRGLRAQGAVDLPESPVVFFEFHGSAVSVAAFAELAADLCREAGASHLVTAHRPDEIARIWKMRHGVAEVEKRMLPGAEIHVTDVCVPVSALPDLVARAGAELDRLGLLAPLSGHVADGNLHYVLLVPPGQAEATARAERFTRWLGEAALDLGGTLSGEHGIGMGKRKLMGREHGAALDTMRRIKHALDPGGIMNPGKVLPDPAPDRPDRGRAAPA